MDPIVHFEIPADDLARAQKFYESTLGWQIKKFPMPDMEYYGAHTTETDENNMIKKIGAINGGLMKRTESVSSPIIAAQVENIDETIKKMEAAGGSLVAPKTEIAQMGWYAYVKDTEGNVIGVWQNMPGRS